MNFYSFVSFDSGKQELFMSMGDTIEDAFQELHKVWPNQTFILLTNEDDIALYEESMLYDE